MARVHKVEIKPVELTYDYVLTLSEDEIRDLRYLIGQAEGYRKQSGFSPSHLFSSITEALKDVK